MTKYIIRRLLSLIPILLGIILLIMGIMSLIPGSPGLAILGPDAPAEAVEELNHELGYDQPFLTRYVTYVANLLKGDLGDSYRTSRPVWYEISRRLPTSVTLAFLAVGLAMLIAIPLGILSAVKQYSLADVSLTTLAMVLNSMPTFWLGLMLTIIFSLKLGLLPSIGLDSPKHYVLPVIALSSYTIASLMRLTRTTMLETIRQDYVRTARAKGQKESVVIFRHALQNALLPVITSAGMSFGKMIGGVVAVESVFSIDGVGNMILSAIRNKDVMLVTGGILCLATIYMLVLLFVDILYAVIDPRVREKYRNKY